MSEKGEFAELNRKKDEKGKMSCKKELRTTVGQPKTNKKTEKIEKREIEEKKGAKRQWKGFILVRKSRRGNTAA